MKEAEVAQAEADVIKLKLLAEAEGLLKKAADLILGLRNFAHFEEGICVDFGGFL